MNNRQLQHGDPLPFRELCYQHAAAIGKLDRVMVSVRNVGLYRAEFPDPGIGCSRPKPSVVVFDILGECQFGPRKQADRDGGFAL
jgi:hypothetical protein